MNSTADVQEDAHFIKRKVKSGSIDVHPTDKALIVNYEVEAVILGGKGEPVLSDRKECQKVIRLKGLTDETDCTSLAGEIIDKCRLIHPSKLADVEHLLCYLQNRKDSISNGDKENWSTNGTNDSGSEKGNLLELENYVELLYEDMFDKIKGSALILDVAKQPMNLDELVSNESLLSALSRVLREDWKKSLDLSINIVGVFSCFSEYTMFHGIISQYKIGSLCMEIIQRELKRYHETKDEILRLPQTKSPANQVSKLPLPKSTKTESKSKSLIPVKGALKVTDKRESVKPVQNASSAEMDRFGHRKKNLDKLIQKQTQLLHVCFSLLLNISENEKVEDKIRKRNIVEFLISSLNTSSIELSILVLKFLKKLSVYRENKDQMVILKIMEKVPKLSTIKNCKLENYVLRLLYNLSFDSNAREEIMKCGHFGDLIGQLQTASASDQKYVLGILYHLSIDDKNKQNFASSGCVQIMNKMIFSTDNSDILLALYLNLALNKDCALNMIQPEHIKMLINTAIKEQHNMYIKIARNIAMHNAAKYVFTNYAGVLLDCILHCKNEDFVLECLGLLSSLSPDDVDFSQLLQTFDAITYIEKCLKSDKADDLILEVVVLLGTVMYDENCAELLHDKGILSTLIELLKSKQEDDEIVLQIMYVFYQALQHPFTRDYLVKHSDIPAYFIDLMHDNNANIRKVCTACLEVIREFDESWTDRIKEEKFNFHNSHWLEMIQNRILDNLGNQDDGDTESDYFPSYNFLQNSAMFQSSSSIEGTLDVASSSVPYSADSSRCISRRDSDEEFDVELQNRKKSLEKQDPMRDALKNLIITADIDSN